MQNIFEVKKKIMGHKALSFEQKLFTSLELSLSSGLNLGLLIPTYHIQWSRNFSSAGSEERTKRDKKSAL